MFDIYLYPHGVCLHVSASIFSYPGVYRLYRLPGKWEDKRKILSYTRIWIYCTCTYQTGATFFLYLPPPPFFPTKLSMFHTYHTHIYCFTSVEMNLEEISLSKRKIAGIYRKCNNPKIGPPWTISPQLRLYIPLLIQIVPNFTGGYTESKFFVVQHWNWKGRVYINYEIEFLRAYFLIFRMPIAIAVPIVCLSQMYILSSSFCFFFFKWGDPPPLNITILPLFFLFSTISGFFLKAFAQIMVILFHAVRAPIYGMESVAWRSSVLHKLTWTFWVGSILLKWPTISPHDGVLHNVTLCQSKLACFKLYAK